MHLQVDKQQPNTTEIAPDGSTKYDRGRSKQARGAPNTTPVTPNEQGERQTRHQPIQTWYCQLYGTSRGALRKEKNRTLYGVTFSDYVERVQRRLVELPATAAEA